MPDIFISHASEDKDAVARPLADALKRSGCYVWFDETTLRLGDSLRREIDRGLAACSFGVVVLSPAFFAKEWPQRELDGLVTREAAERTKRILPVWHNVSADDVARFSPTLADRLGVSTARGIDAVAAAILNAAVPQASMDGGTTNPSALPPRRRSKRKALTALAIVLAVVGTLSAVLFRSKPTEERTAGSQTVQQPPAVTPESSTTQAVDTVAAAKPRAVAAQPAAQALPRLFLLSVGINDYGHPASNRRSAVAAARAFAALFARQEGKNFSSVESVLITESQATRAKVAQALQSWAGDATPDDMAVLFLSGRSGTFDVDNAPGRYAFVCFDTDQREPERTGIPGKMILDVSANIACPKIVFIDTPTYAGIHPQLPSDVTSTTEQRKLPALAIMQASWSGGAPETEYGQSMFARAVLDGLGFAADANRDGALTFSELWAYVMARGSRDAALTVPHEFREINFNTVLTRTAAP